jgi:hypothetical protein
MLIATPWTCQHIEKVITGELATLIGVEDLGLAFTQSVLQRIVAEA